MKGKHYIFLWRFLGLFKAWKGNQNFVTWIAKFDIVLQKLRNSWMDPLLIHRNSQLPSSRIRPLCAYETNRNRQHMQNSSCENGIANVKTPTGDHFLQ